MNPGPLRGPPPAPGAPVGPVGDGRIAPLAVVDVGRGARAASGSDAGDAGGGTAAVGLAKRGGILAASALAVLLGACGPGEGASGRGATPGEPTAKPERSARSRAAARAEAGSAESTRPASPNDRPDAPDPPALPSVDAPPPDAPADGLPRDVPRPAGATPVETHTFANGDRLVGYEADEAPGPVFRRLREDLESRGWTLEHVLDGEVQKILRASKDGYRVIALVVPQADVTRIALRAVKIEE